MRQLLSDVELRCAKAFAQAVPPAGGMRPLRTGSVRAEETWEFGDAADSPVSATTKKAIVEEEREMTEKEKEIAESSKSLVKDALVGAGLL